MNRPRPQRSRSTEEVESAWDDVLGIVMIGLAVLYFLALFSYDPRDLPTWSRLSPSAQPNAVTQNFVGRMGALAAGYSLFLLGAATYLIPFCLTWFGVCKMTSNLRVTARAWLGLVLIVLSAAALLHIQGWFQLRNGIAPFGGGGGVGHLLGGVVFDNLLGKVGSTFVLGLCYCIGLVFVTGLHPLDVLSSLKGEIPKLISQWKMRQAYAGVPDIVVSRLPVPAPPAAPVAAPRRKPRGAKVSEITPDSLAPEEMVTTELPLQFDPPPPPQIIDASAPRVPSKSDKPPLAEVWEKKRAQKLERISTAPVGSLTEVFKDYKLPSLDLLRWPQNNGHHPADRQALLDTQATIVRTLASFGITVTPGDITRGPAITRFEVRPSDGLRVARIANLDADLARATKAERINILAPIPGKDTVGIELANTEKVIVPVRELLEDDAFQNGKARLPLALGKDVYGKTIIGDLAAMPHLLVAGATGSGKSVCINSIVTSLLCRFAPDELRFILIDPKVVEMQTYANLPHLALPVVTDPKKALMALRWVVREMETRYQIFAQEGCRNFEVFNNRNRKKAAASSASAAPVASLATEPPVLDAPLKPRKPLKETTPEMIAEMDDNELFNVTLAPPAPGEDWTSDASPPPRPKHELVIPDTMPYIVVIIDELADLMQTAPADIEVAIARITQMARAAGIHLIVATQTPRADVITGVIKANVPSRIAFQVASALDSRVILDRKGAENLVGKGDMLYVPPGGSQPVRSQGALVTDDEIHGLVQYCESQGRPIYDAATEAGAESFEGEEGEGGVSAEEEETLEKCLEVVRQEKKASTSLFQRRLRLGYGRAARMMDLLEDRGIIGPGEGAKPREILVELG
ncbi:MAG: DNA translocase FtsK [Verrucomicrobiaceae bacterium]|nr:DNA translocase FtsK [Verrucomicrobiaceae bacterium]